MDRVAYIIGGYRTAVGSFRGGLSSIRTDDLAAIPIKAVMEKFSIPDSALDEVILGCANQAGEDNRNIARMALLLAGVHYSVPGETVNRLCASGMSSVIHGCRSIICGDANLIIAGGVEHMTRAPWVVSKSATPFGSDSQMFDSSFGWRFVNPKMKEMYGTEAMGETAENLADLYYISRSDQDTFALNSQKKASHARITGRLGREIVPVLIKRHRQDDYIFDQDEFIKPDSTLEGLNKLKPAFRTESGSVTAGNASGLNDGAAAILVASAEGMATHGLHPLVRVVGSAVAGVEPRIMGIGPVRASQIVLGKAGLRIEDMDIIEINEAFAVQVLACTRALGLRDDDPRINPNGGAIALGHPLGMSGTRILLTAAIELNEQNKRYALVTMCIGVGQGYAVIIENCNL